MTEQEPLPNPEDLFKQHSMGGVKSVGKLIENIWYLFFRKGIGYEEFKNTPLPYILTVVRKESERLEAEEKEMKKSKKGRK